MKHYPITEHMPLDLQADLTAQALAGLDEFEAIPLMAMVAAAPMIRESWLASLILRHSGHMSEETFASIRELTLTTSALWWGGLTPSERQPYLAAYAEIEKNLAGMCETCDHYADCDLPEKTESHNV